MQRSLVCTAVAALAAASCGGSSQEWVATLGSSAPAVTSTSVAPTTTGMATSTSAATSLPSTTVAPTTTAAPATSAPATTVAPTTEPPVTTAPPPPATTAPPPPATTAAPPPVTTAPPPPPPPPGYSGYTNVTDDSGLISVSVPVEWADTRGDLWDSTLATGTEEEIGPALSAAPNLEAFNTQWDTPGVFIGASAMLAIGPDELLDARSFANVCSLNGRFDYDDGSYTGRYDEYVECGGTTTKTYVIAAEPPTQNWMALLLVQVVSEADEEALGQIIDSWVVQELAG